MKKPNLLVLGGVLILIVIVAVLAAFLPRTRTLSNDAPSLEIIEASCDEPVFSSVPTPTAAPQTEAYLVVSVRGMVYEPLPLAGEGVFAIKQDESTSNTVHVTPTSVWMEHSTCDNQDCVDQGLVSLENIENRVLGNMIICLPNEVVLELHTPETLETSFGGKP